MQVVGRDDDAFADDNEGQLFDGNEQLAFLQMVGSSEPNAMYANPFELSPHDLPPELARHGGGGGGGGGWGKVDDHPFGDEDERGHHDEEAAGDEGTQPLIGASAVGVTNPRSSGTGASPSFWHLAYFQPYFDVDTRQVLSRLGRAANPRHKWHLVADEGKADLYGPFWVTITLVFAVAMSGNLGAWFALVASGHHTAFTPDFTKVTLALSILFGYVFIFSGVVWFWLRMCEARCSLVHMWCAFGYAMVSFIPASLVCVVPNNLLRWALLSLATALSGQTIGTFVWHVVTSTMVPSQLKSKGVPIVATVAGVHLLVGLLLKLYFFAH